MALQISDIVSAFREESDALFTKQTETIQRQIDPLRESVFKLDKQVSDLTKKVGRLTTNVEHLDDKVEKLDKRLDKLETKFKELQDEVQANTDDIRTSAYRNAMSYGGAAQAEPTSHQPRTQMFPYDLPQVVGAYSLRGE